MPGNPPVEATIEKVLSTPGDPWGDEPQKRTYDEVLFAGESATRKVYAPADAPVLKDGATVKGWFNEQKGHFSVAGERPPQNGAQRGSGGSDAGRRDDATGLSIERQVSGYVTAELLKERFSDLGPEELAITFQMMFAAVHTKIAGAEPDAS